jgi:hypothetical protein
MLTTVDNPYDPFDDFDSWFAFDSSHGYHTSSFLARIVVTSNLAIETAINEIVQENVLGIYRKVSREVESKSISLE